MKGMALQSCVRSSVQSTAGQGGRGQVCSVQFSQPGWYKHMHAGMHACQGQAEVCRFTDNGASSSEWMTRTRIGAVEGEAAVGGGRGVAGVVHVDAAAHHDHACIVPALSHAGIVRTVIMHAVIVACHLHI